MCLFYYHVYLFSCLYSFQDEAIHPAFELTLQTSKSYNKEILGQA